MSYFPEQNNSKQSVNFIKGQQPSKRISFKFEADSENNKEHHRICCWTTALNRSVERGKIMYRHARKANCSFRALKHLARCHLCRILGFDFLNILKISSAILRITKRIADMFELICLHSP